MQHSNHVVFCPPHDIRLGFHFCGFFWVVTRLCFCCLFLFFCCCFFQLVLLFVFVGITCLCLLCLCCCNVFFTLVENCSVVLCFC